MTLPLELPEPAVLLAYDGGVRLVWPHPAEQGPPMEALERLVERAEALALAQWQREHGELPPPAPAGRLFTLPRPRRLGPR